jgi:pimeloyl-ACP methyl ester carboxylesterase
MQALPDNLPPWLKVMYPFTPVEVPVGGGDWLSCLDEGQGEETLVCVHGNPTWSFYYRELVLALRDRCRVVVPDHLGCGLSSKPEKGTYTLQAHVERLVALLERLEIRRYHLLVHDWGGPIGLGASLRDDIELQSVTLLNTAAFAFPRIPLRIAVCRWPLVGRLLVRGLNGFVEAATRMTTVQALPDAVKEAYRHPYGSWAERVAIHEFVKDIPMGKGHRSWKALKAIEGGLGQLADVPVQIIWGMQDWCFHTGILAEWRRRLPSATITELPQVGHYVMEEAAGKVVEQVAARLVQSSD